MNTQKPSDIELVYAENNVEKAEEQFNLAEDACGYALKGNKNLYGHIYQKWVKMTAVGLRTPNGNTMFKSVVDSTAAEHGVFGDKYEQRQVIETIKALAEVYYSIHLAKMHLASLKNKESDSQVESPKSGE